MVARQHGHPIFYLTANFQRPEEGFDHQDAMPEVPAPDERADVRPDRRSSAPATTRPAPSFAKEWAALDTRYLGNSAHPGHTHLSEDPTGPPAPSSGSGSTATSATTPTCHVAAFTYASDLTLLGAALVPHDVEIGSPELMPASLDHTIWFHRPFRADRVVALRPVVAVGQRRPRPVARAASSPRTAAWSPPWPRRA